MRILAVSIDLDDTLWPVAPAIRAAEQQLDAWLRTHHAEVAAAWPIDALRELRERIADERPDLAHDFTAQRRLTLQHAFAACGADEAPVAEACEIYLAARNRVEFYPDALPALSAIASRLPVVSISNGNADLVRIGLDHHFRHRLSAREFGCAKPDTAIFREACARLELAPEYVLHVGDDPVRDVSGAHSAGLRTAWLNRNGAEWNETIAPDLKFDELGQLARWIEGRT